MARKTGCPYVTDEVFVLSGYVGITLLASGVLTGCVRSGSFPVETLTRQPKLVQKGGEFSGDSDAGAFSALG